MEIIEKYVTILLLAVFFVAFALKNIFTKKNTKVPVKGNSLPVNLMVIISGTLYTIILLDIFIDTPYFIKLKFMDKNFFKISGFIFMLTGISIGIISLFTMRDSWRVGIRQEQRTDLIINGVFQFSRNPFFFSYIIFFLGGFFIYPSAFLLFFYIAMIIVIHIMILDEERYLTRVHGKEYLNYKKSVNRYISFIKLK